MSPKLFNIFYDTLIEKIDNLKYFIIAYADDIVNTGEGLERLRKTIIK